MKEIGGYIELDKYNLPMLHEEAVRLNSARSCLAYLIESKGIKKIALPKFLCRVVSDICKRYKVDIRYYSIGLDFKPIKEDIECESIDNEWFYLVNFYGQISNSYMLEMKERYEKLIVDNVQSYYQKPIEGVDTIYTCRKYFGVPDGAFLYTDKIIDRKLERATSFERISHILGRYENKATEFYDEYKKCEEKFSVDDILEMSKLTYNLLHGIDYNLVRMQRHKNYILLHETLKNINKLKLAIIPDAPFMYPLYIENASEIRKKLIKENIFVPMLWPDILEVCQKNQLEYDLAENILPLPVDQRYTDKDMNYMIQKLMEKVY